MALPPVVAIIFAALAFLQVPGINGPRYWKWHWHRNANPFGVAAALGVAALPALAAQVIRERAPERRRLMAALLVLSSVALPVTESALHAGRTSAGWIRAVMLDPSVTGYIRSAEEIIEFEQRRHDVDWLRVYDKIMTYFPLHARTKPLGMVTAHYLSVRAFGANATIFVAAAFFLFCAVASVLMMLVAFRWMGFSENAAIDAATLLVLAPSMTLFFPVPDIAYPLLTLTAVAFWWRALNVGQTLLSVRAQAGVPVPHLFAAAVAALAIFVASLISYPLIAIGIPLLLMTIVRPPRTVVAPLAVAAATFFGAYGLLFAITHYPPIATFRSAVASQHWLLGRLHRPYPQSIPFDVLDYCLGLGWVIPVLAVLKRSPYNILAVAGLLTPIILALTGQLQAENARVWIFLMPLTILPAALELSEWPLRARLASCASLVIVTIALASTMDFIFA